MRSSEELSWQYVDDSGRLVGPTAPATLLPTVYLHPGQLVVATHPMQVTTILGSCVAVCLWDPSLGIGGANHYLLPTGLKSASNSLRYGNVAIEELLDRVARAGAQASRLRAKLFGGACVLDAMRNGTMHLGQRNVEIAQQTLAAAGIPVVDEDVGGSRGRKLVYQPHEGSAMVKLL